MEQCLQQVSDALITHAQHVEQHTQRFETRREMIGGDPLRVDAKRVLTFQACITLCEDVRMPQIAPGLARVNLMKFEGCAGALTLGFGMFPRATRRCGNDGWLELRDANGNVHRTRSQ